MKKALAVIFVGIVLVLVSLAGCSIANQSSLTTPAIATLLEIKQTDTPAPVPPTPAATPTRVNLTPLPPEVSGVVVGANGPLADAIVQIQGTNNKTLTTDTGAFTLSGISGKTPLVVTAWSEGHYVGWTTLNPSDPEWKGGQDVRITLKPLPEKDNNLYPWFSFEGVKGSASCGLCHREYAEFKADAHSQAGQNPRFLSMYSGTDINGNQSQATEWGSGGAALPPDPNQPYYGPGFRLDSPNRAGNCATCHTPIASKVPNQKNCGWSGCHTDLTIERSQNVIDPHTLPLGLNEDAAEGISCDFCHKIGAVTIDPHTKLPPPDMPGILSIRLYRPEEGQQVFFGTLVDVNRRNSYLPLETKSEFCAPCHYGVFGGVVGVGKVTGGVVIYNSYGEWLDSPYSNPQTGKTCQDCHMPVANTDWFVFPERGGIARDYAPLHYHTMPGVTDEQLMKNAVSMKSQAARVGNHLQVEVSITNDKTGHHVPTDAPIRSMMLVVEAFDVNGNPLNLVQGPTLPSWTGNYAEKPGKAFAKVLRDDWTGETPTAAYWRPVTVVEDTRLAAMATDTTNYLFDLTSGDAATIRIHLVFRRAFQSLAQLKGWTDPDLIMAEQTIQLEK
jgi:hypothetical protein